MTPLPALHHLLGAYLNYDWPDDYADVWEGVDDFLTDEPGLAARLPEEIAGLLRTATSEAELRRVVVDELGSGYLPEGDGLTCRDWLQRVARRAETTRDE